MSEKAFWHSLAKNMAKGKYWREATRHEDKMQAGIADVSFVGNNGKHGWIELKQINEWPVRPTTLVRMPHFTDAQRIWLKRKGEAGGNTWILVKIDRDVLLFHWEYAPLLGFLDGQNIMGYAAGIWKNRVDYEELGKLLCGQ